MPKLFLVIFVGSQVANLSDGKTRGEMSTLTKVLDVFTIVASIGLAVWTGWYVNVSFSRSLCKAFAAQCRLSTFRFVWRQTEKRIRHMQGEGLTPEIDREAADALDDASRPLLRHVLSSSESLVDDEQSPLVDVLDQLDGNGKSANDSRV